MPLATTVRSRFRQASDEGFALVVAMLFILLVGVLSMTALALVLNESKPTQVLRKNIETINAADSGLQAATTLLRNSTTGSSTGVLAQLPCGTKATLTGSVQGQGGRDGYTTTIRYFQADPTDHDKVWLDAHADPLCPLLTPPQYALIENTATSTAQPAVVAVRQSRATYVFTVTNVQSLGGAIAVGNLCWDVGTAPAAGTNITYATCAPVGTKRQMFQYRQDLSLFWTDGTLKFCVDYSNYWTGSVDDATRPWGSVPMTLHDCAATSGQFGTAYNPGTAKFVPTGAKYQEFASHTNWWAVEPDGSRIGEVTNTGGSRPSCIGVDGGAVVAGAVVSMNPGWGCSALEPAAGVGAGGAAGITSGLPGPTKQLVNYTYFGSCMDVAGSQVGTTSRLITWPCHQAPDPAKVEGNQQFSFSGSAGGTGTLITRRTDAGASPTEVDGSGDYDASCATQDPTATAGEVRFLPCTAFNARQQWTLSGPLSENYSASYTIKNLSTGECLEATGGGTSASTVALRDCNGSLAQKWNAPPNFTQSAIVGNSESTDFTSP